MRGAATWMLLSVAFLALPTASRASERVWLKGNAPTAGQRHSPVEPLDLADLGGSLPAEARDLRDAVAAASRITRYDGTETLQLGERRVVTRFSVRPEGMRVETAADVDDDGAALVHVRAANVVLDCPAAPAPCEQRTLDKVQLRRQRLLEPGLWPRGWRIAAGDTGWERHRHDTDGAGVVTLRWKRIAEAPTVPVFARRAPQPVVPIRELEIRFDPDSGVPRRMTGRDDTGVVVWERTLEVQIAPPGQANLALQPPPGRTTVNR